MKFVFLHIGIDERPQILVESIRRVVPEAEIIQCTNARKYEIPGVDKVFISDGDANNIMTFRLRAFSDLGLLEPAVYLDTDIIILRRPEISKMLRGEKNAICKRSFDTKALFNTSFNGMNLAEYKNKTLEEVYPYLASFNITESFLFWRDCYHILQSLDKKFHFWYGDQEAIRELLKRPKYSFSEIMEADVSCLPEFLAQNPDATAIHFKGHQRKELMKRVWSELLSQPNLKSLINHENKSR